MLMTGTVAPTTWSTHVAVTAASTAFTHTPNAAGRSMHGHGLALPDPQSPVLKVALCERGTEGRVGHERILAVIAVVLEVAG